MVDSWCKAIKEERRLGAIRSMLRAFRFACHCGDDSDVTLPKFSIVSSNVFNKIMLFVLNEMDGILRGLLGAPNTGGRKETIMDLTTTKTWTKHGTLMRIYLSNTLHILTEMTDEQMISFTLKRVKASGVFLAAFPTLLRKYINVALHSWGTGRGALPIVSFLFLRDLCVRLGSDCLDTCLKGCSRSLPKLRAPLSAARRSMRQREIGLLDSPLEAVRGSRRSAAAASPLVPPLSPLVRHRRGEERSVCLDRRSMPARIAITLLAAGSPPARALERREQIGC
ncbi:uncharacterized protein A4U43_C01F11950 [Asparagus officinalis]|uniref:Uncharacterized protein n=1 Tax=Asparagus officinalis TaxID=4686 RepID=A0A5P1FTC2_ASPOF|nr:uncharacterized protein A4U43_C01F11950 [Asparagus officinalis]